MLIDFIKYYDKTQVAFGGWKKEFSKKFIYAVIFL